ncbi:MAG: alpha-D-ribose 1-methylphosphonate 5-triphosphate diphosphatase [Alphaproteobacteria bacterium]
MTERIAFENARIVTANAVIEGGLIADGGVIRELTPRGRKLERAIDFAGDYLMPGLVELHTDNLERQFQPRPSVRWPPDAAMLAHDQQVSSAGITTVCDAVAVGFHEGKRERTEFLQRSIDALAHANDAGALKADHHLHLRCEITSPHVVEMFEPLKDHPSLRVISFMDHTPGQRQWHDLGKYRHFHSTGGRRTEAELDALVEKRLEEQKLYGERHRRALLERIRGLAVTLASHDDTTVAHVEEAAGDGMTISEFPTTGEAAAAAHAHGMKTIMGAPNVIIGGSHSGNVAALDLARSGHLDALSSDYVPVSLLHAVFRLVEQADLALPAATAKVSRNPAVMAGFDDRGEISPGLRADLLRVRLVGDTPSIMSVWRQGERVA